MDGTTTPESSTETSSAEKVTGLSSAADGDHPHEWKAGRQEWLIIITLVIISLMASLDATILVPVLPTLATELHGTATDTFWAGTAFLLTNAVVQPFLATLSDIFGRREILFLSLVLFTVGTLICCLSNNFTQLLAGRSVQGVGGGGIVVMVLVIMTDIVPLRQRPKYNLFNMLAWALGTIIGPLVGGLIAQHTTWRWIFYLNFPFCAVGLTLVSLVVNLKAEKTSLKFKLARVDWIGGILFTGSMTSFLIAIASGGVEFAWNSFRTLVPLMVGAVGIFIALVWEVWGTKTPFLRLFLFKNRSACLAYTCAALQGFLLFQAVYYIPCYFEVVKGFSPTITGVAMLPMFLTLLPASMVVGLLMTKTGKFRPTLWFGQAMLVLSNGLLILLGVNISTIGWLFVLITLGIGHGCTLTPLIFGTQAMAKTEDVAYSAAMYAFLRALGYSIGVAIGGSAFQNSLSSRLVDAGLPTSIAVNAESYVAVLKAMAVDSPLRHQLVQVYAQAFKVVWEVMTGFAALGFLLSLGIAHYSLDRKYDSKHKVCRAENDEERRITS